MEHPILIAIRREGFEPLGWFEPSPQDGLGESRFIMLIGNAGPAMFARFVRERDARRDSLDQWTKQIVDALAARLDAAAVYPFDRPSPPFLSWAKRAGSGFQSPLGLNIHPDFGLWHAFRAALLFPVAFDLPRAYAGRSPCDTCADRPCLSACPVGAFTGASYAVETCAAHLATDAGADCMNDGCRARRACPVGRHYRYRPEQALFHMQAFRRAHPAVEMASQDR